jgi:hypothetical protein
VAFAVATFVLVVSGGFFTLQPNETLNEQRGKSIELAAVVVWGVQDAARATFDVEGDDNYVKIRQDG